MIPTNEKSMMTEGMLLWASQNLMQTQSSYSLNDKAPEVLAIHTNYEESEKSQDHDN